MNTKSENRENKDRYRELVDLAVDGILLGSHEGIITEINKCMCSMIGISREEIIGKHISQVPFCTESIKNNPWRFDLLKKGEVVVSERVLIRPDSSHVIVEMRTKMMPDGTYHSIYRDVTQSKKLMEHSFQSKKLESLGILAGGIAHDFNNLLSGIFGYIGLANEITTEPDVSEYLVKSLNTIEIARGLTKQLLTFSKGGDPVRKTDHLFPFLKETALFALNGSNVTCKFNYPDDLPACRFDRNQIGQAFDNLIINAQQSMPDGGTVELSACRISFQNKEHPLLEKGDYVKIAIKDSGIGIPKEFLTKIFDPFFTTKSKGHGLGLATSYSIIKKHFGCIEAESQQGEGSTFYVYIPVFSEKVEPSAFAVSSKHKKSGTILVMDDEKIIRDIISKMLISIGYSVVCKENGEDAIKFFSEEIKESRKVEAMIFDLTIPGGMGGKEVIEKIREMDKEIPVFVVSGYAEDPVMADPQKYGFTASICKPFSMAELTEMFKTNLR